MRVLFCSDIHLGNHKRFGGTSELSLNRRCAQVLEVLNEAVNTAIQHGCEWFVVCGDLFDSTKPEPQLIAATMGVLSRLEGCKVVLMVGNHELVSDQEGDHALAPFFGQCTLVQTSRLLQLSSELDLLCIPYQGPHADVVVDQALHKLDLASTNPRLVAIHYGIKHDKTEPWLMSASDGLEKETIVSLMREHDLWGWLAGHWHNHFSERVILKRGPFVCQIGALAPTGFDNPGAEGYGTCLIFDTERKQAFVFELSGPRFIRCSEIDADAVNALTLKGHSVYLSVSCSVEDKNDQLAALGDLIESDSLVIDGEVLVDGDEVREAARTAASAALSSETLVEAVEAYVSKMPLDEGVERDNVLSRVKELLRV